MVLRAITSKIPSFESLNLPPVLKQIALKKRGLVIFVGGTGSGKSTSLASMIDYRNENSQDHIITIEDPIEFVHQHKSCIISQREVGVDTDNWFARAKGMENEPEKGIRCTMCFDMRFMRTALYAHEHGFPVITSSLGISRWKNMNQINDSGVRAAEPYDGVEYWTFNWRKGGGSQRMIDISKRERFYQQEYCGCVYSLRDTNAHRVSQGREEIRIGELFYGDEDSPSA